MKNRIQVLMPLLALAALVGCADTATMPEGGLRPADSALLSANGQRYWKVKVNDGVSPALTFEVGPGGGTYHYGGHSLHIPGGAVSGPTIFEVQLLDPEHAVVRFTATRKGSSSKNDVGRAGFPRQLTLTVSYAALAENADESRFLLGWLNSASAVTPFNGTVNRSQKTVTVQLNHFSDYALIVP